MANCCFWSISNQFNNIHVHSSPPHKRRPVCLQKTLFELERYSNAMIISARCLHNSNRCYVFILILMGSLESMFPLPPLFAALYIDSNLTQTKLETKLAFIFLPFFSYHAMLTCTLSSAIYPIKKLRGCILEGIVCLASA